MKSFGLQLIASTLITSYAWAYTDTAAFYSSQELGREFDYITESSSLSGTLKELTEQICGDSKEKITIYRVQNLLNDHKLEKGSYIKHVHYSSAHELDFLGESCSSKAQYFTSPTETDSQVVVIDIEDDKKHTIGEFLGGEGSIIVQGKPSFHKPGSQINALKSFVEDKVYENLNIDVDLDRMLSKRSENVVSESEMDEIKADILLDIQKVDDAIISIDGKDIDIDIQDLDSDLQSTSSAAPLKKNSNLFTEYQFFTPGLWLCLIVSGFLVFVLSIALSWISSLEISYSSFDKQIDFEKKNE